ncbi:uncharacterized protein METZ01_LOCUS80683, partial [marine metagenome]
LDIPKSSNSLLFGLSAFRSETGTMAMIITIDHWVNVCLLINYPP